MSSELSQTEPVSRLSLTFGGKVLRFEPAGSDVMFTLDGVRPRFLAAQDVPADCVVTCALGEPVPTPVNVLYEGQDVWDLRQLESGHQQVCYYSAIPGGRIPWATLTLEPSLKAATLVRRPLWGGDPSIRVGFPFDEYLMCRLLARQGGFVLHAAAVEYDGMGLLFAGHSGAGKSTISEIAETVGARILSDDRAIITLQNDDPVLWGTPWHGSHRKGESARAPLRGIFLLVQDQADGLVPLLPARAVGEIFVRLIHPTVDAGETAAVLDSVATVVAKLAVHELHFRPTPDAFRLAVEYIRALTVA
jgi:hypothetical protein